MDDSECTKESVLADNRKFMRMADVNGIDYILIDDQYDLMIEEKFGMDCRK